MQFVSKPIQINRQSKHSIKTNQQKKGFKLSDSKQQSHDNRLSHQRQKRFKRHNDQSNHSKSSSNCSDSNSISRFYVKNISKAVEQENLLKKEQNNAETYGNQILDNKKTKLSFKQQFNMYGLGSDTNKQSKIKATQSPKQQTTQTNQSSNFLKRQLSPTQLNSPKKNTINTKSSTLLLFQNSYNFLSTTPLSKKVSPPPTNRPGPQSIMHDLKNKNALLQLQLDRCKNNQKKFILLNQQLQNKTKKLNERISYLEQQIQKINTNNKNMKQENHKLKILVKQRDNLMTTLMRKQQNSGSNELLVSKIIQFQYQNQQLKESVQKLKKEIGEKHFNQTESLASSRLQHSSSGKSLLQNPSFLMGNQSQLVWDESQFQDCIEQKDKEIIELREQIKNLQIQINYINRKWTNEVDRVKKIQQLEYMKLKQKYKAILIRYKDNVKSNFVLPPDRKKYNLPKNPKKRIKNEQQNEQMQNIQRENCQRQQPLLLDDQDRQLLTPLRRRKRNYTVDHLKGRGVMSEIKPNHYYESLRRSGHPYQEVTDIELLEYSSCQDEGL